MYGVCSCTGELVGEVLGIPKKGRLRGMQGVFLSR